ncbi:hypothetical protein C441_16244 [Haloferax sulfurifontis ATCC BAA-897]|uniref:Uncharacterized protein n=1 Tax=Haloferax sulfurifontis ATCC BAA-897 TaxID=662480 RepID=M0HZD4_9EURY|nr:hypothetical protein C441_16244 [Haloferax sulfurifontis ATCC BAA-897]
MMENTGYMNNFIPHLMRMAEQPLFTKHFSMISNDNCQRVLWKFSMKFLDFRIQVCAGKIVEIFNCTYWVSNTHLFTTLGNPFFC